MRIARRDWKRRKQESLRENDDIGPPKLLALFDDPHTKSKLQIEMAATVDWGEPFVKACYVLEGDGPLVLRCYEVIDRVRQSIVTENIPNVRALSEKLTRQSHSWIMLETVF